MKKLTYIFVLIIFAVAGFNTALAQEEATGEADSVRQRVQEKIQQALANPKAYIGVITDKAQGSLQIESQEGEIQLISVDSEETTFVRINDETEELTYEEVGLGDFVIAMGIVDENDVLETTRVLLTSTPEEPEREIVFGNMAGVENRILTIENNGETWNFEFPRRWKGPEIVEIEEAEKVAVVGVPDDEGKMIIRTIEITSSSPASEDE